MYQVHRSSPFPRSMYGTSLRESGDRPVVPGLFRRDDHRERTRCARTRRSSAALRSTSTRVRRSSAFSSRSVSAFLSKPAEAVLLPLDPQEILNLLPSTRAWDLRAQKRAT